MPTEPTDWEERVKRTCEFGVIPWRDVLTLLREFAEEAAGFVEEDDCDQTEYMCHTISRIAAKIRAMIPARKED